MRSQVYKDDGCKQFIIVLCEQHHEIREYYVMFYNYIYLEIWLYIFTFTFEQ